MREGCGRIAASDDPAHRLLVDNRDGGPRLSLSPAIVEQICPEHAVEFLHSHYGTTAGDCGGDEKGARVLICWQARCVAGRNPARADRFEQAPR